MRFVENERGNYEKIFFTTKLGRPYIYYLTYGDQEPGVFRNDSEIEREALGFVHVLRLENVYFMDSLPDLELENDILYFGLPGKIPENVNVIKTFKLLNGEEALIAYEKE